MASSDQVLEVLETLIGNLLRDLLNSFTIIRADNLPITLSRAPMWILVLTYCRFTDSLLRMTER